MFAESHSVTFLGADTKAVRVQAQLAPGLPAFTMVGLPDKAVAESRERIRAAIHNLGLALPPKRITINLSPADLAKEGSHFDVAIALALLAAMEVIPANALSDLLIVGELSLDGRISRVPGVLPAAIAAKSEGKRLLCPFDQAMEAAWVDEGMILPTRSLLEAINALTGKIELLRPHKPMANRLGQVKLPDIRDIK